MNRTLLALAIASLLAACSQPQEPPKTQATTAPAAPPAAASTAAQEPLKSGIDVFQGDPNVKAGEDFYRHVNGKWLDTFEIPADKPGYGSFTKVFDETQEHLHSIIDKISQTPNSNGSNPQKDRRSLSELHGRGQTRPARRHAAQSGFRRDRRDQGQEGNRQAARRSGQVDVAVRIVRPIGHRACRSSPSSIRTTRIRPNTSSISSRAASACPTATITSRTTTPSSSRCAPTTRSTSRRCSRWPRTRTPRKTRRTSSRSRPNSPRRSGPRSTCATRRRRTTRSNSPSSTRSRRTSTGKRISTRLTSAARRTTSSSASRPT